jgi:hypothetical protein
MAEFDFITNYRVLSALESKLYKAKQSLKWTFFKPLQIALTLEDLLGIKVLRLGMKMVFYK